MRKLRLIEFPTLAIEGRLEEGLYAAAMILPSNYGYLDKIGWSRSSRTDKGVHSLSTVVAARLEGMWSRVDLGNGNYEYDIEDECIKLPEMINQHLPPEIRVVAAAQVPYGFDARKSCIHRHYEYLIPLSELKGSAYTEDREAWNRMLQMFVGRHHWHNFGFIERRTKPERRNRREKKFNENEESSNVVTGEEMDNTGDEEVNMLEDEVESMKQAFEENNASQSSNISATTPMNNFPSEEPSLLDSAPGKSAQRPSLYAFDEFRSSQPQSSVYHHNEPSTSTSTPPALETSSSSHRKPREKPKHVPQFADSARFRESSEESAPKQSAFLDADGKEIRLSKLSPLQVASLPLDDHLAQDAFYRTISAASHELIKIKGEDYVRISIQGDSFLLHQVRRMIGTLILTARGIYTEEVLRASIDAPFRILTPRAPSRGLLLRDARFLDLDWKKRDMDRTHSFSSNILYPHMREQWMSSEMLEGEEAELRALELFEDGNKRPGIWDELHSTQPISNIRDIIPGYDEWVRWHHTESAQREIKRDIRRTRYESSERTRGRPSYKITTRASF